MNNLVLFLTLMLIWCPQSAPAQDCIDYSEYYPDPAPYLGEIQGSGNSHGLAVLGDRLFVAGSLGVQAFDISAPADPVFLGKTSDSAVSVVATESMVYAIDYEGRLQVINFSDPANPETTSILLDEFMQGEKIAQAGDYLYVTLYSAFSGRFMVVDISNPGSPEVVGNIFTGLGGDIELVGDLAYVTLGYGESSEGYLGIIDISNPANPELITHFDVPGGPVAVEVSYPIAYVAGAFSGIFILDVFNPLDPSIIGSSTGVVRPRNLVLSGDLLYTWGARMDSLSSGLQILDASFPPQLYLLGSEESINYNNDIMCVDSTLFAASDGRGLSVYDVSNPSHPTLSNWSHGISGHAGSLAANSTHVFLNGYSLQIVDFADPVLPSVVATLPMPAYGRSLHLAEDLLVWGGSGILGQSSGHLALVDVSDIENPVLLSTTLLLDAPMEVSTYGSYAYVAAQMQDLMIVDISDVSEPVVVLNLNIPDAVSQSITIAGSYAYLGSSSAVGNGGLRVFDLSNPENPEVVGHLPSNRSFGNITVVGELAFVIDSYNWQVRVVNISDPSHPAFAENVNNTFTARSLTYLEPYLYVGTNSREMLVVDITDPSNMEVVGLTEIPGGVVDFTLSGSRIGIAAGYDGLFLAGSSCEIVSAVEGNDEMALPGLLAVDVYPNPFNPKTTLSFYLNDPQQVRVQVYDVRGRLVFDLADQHFETGKHSLEWMGRDNTGRSVPSGEYFFRMETENGFEIRKAMLVR